MKEAIKNNKKIIIIGIVIIVLLLLGIAFAYLTTTLHGDKEYLVRAGSLGLRLEESNELTLEKQIPLEDSEGMKLDDFNFSLINEGNIDTDFTIYLDDIELDEGETRMPDSAIRYSLTKDNVVGNASDLTSMGVNPNRVVDTGTVAVDETINYTLRIWIDYDATTEEASGKTFKGKLRVVATQPVGEKVSDVVLENLGDNESTYDDDVDTFITGTDPNNYIWYSGKLWRAVSVNNEAKTTKLVTQWNISAIDYSSGSTAFEGSYMEDWLNDTSVDGFLGNLRDYENFIVTDAVWDATLDATRLGSITRPNGEATVTDAVGLLNMYEYQSSNNGGTNGYLNNGLIWWTLTPYSTSSVRYVYSDGGASFNTSASAYGVRPSINLKSSVKIVDGDGTIDNPYRLNGDNDTNLSGTLLSSRYSGEYIKFGNDENNLYRIVSHENGTGTKIVSAEPLKSSGTFITSAFGSNTSFSSSNTIGAFLNGDYLTNYVDSSYSSMIEDNTTWYLGTVGSGTSYKLAKYTDTNMSGYAKSTNAKVGLLRLGELMSGQFDRYGNNTSYWTLTPYSTSNVRRVSNNGSANYNSPSSSSYGVRPSVNLKSNAQIVNGDGTLNSPFEIQLGG
ncbi:MAG TPA: hypothetical protein IAB38_02590 [Candidatus Onthousia excrementipullorum]|uniref:DUF6273 domain-containing protein n=1 Tax=Candidatus Onthousia excrementipullorum TaxID=2840884 RepID=A0A9D1J339_9FIRM|nr:hypothetical protein [Candidatus Onthousia excrementipullorum]